MNTGTKTLLNGIKSFIKKQSTNDYNANEGELGYIKNRPFYTEISTGTSDEYILTQTPDNDWPELTLSESEEFLDNLLISKPEIISINFNGVDYTLSLFEQESSINNILYLNEESNIGFGLSKHDSYTNFGVFHLSGSYFEDGDYPLTITATTEIIHKIDPKYLPDTFEIVYDDNNVTTSAEDIYKAIKAERNIILITSEGYIYPLEYYDGGLEVGIRFILSTNPLQVLNIYIYKDGDNYNLNTGINPLIRLNASPAKTDSSTRIATTAFVKSQVDSELSSTSAYPVQNKVINSALESINTSLDNKMTKGVDYVTAGHRSGTTLGERATAEGNNTTASGQYAHAEGNYSEASGYVSHAEGSSSTASGQSSHAEGGNTTASGNFSHAQGFGTLANHFGQFTFGQYNIEDNSTASSSARGNYVEIVGNGSFSSSTGTVRSNARTLNWSGKEWLADTLEVSRDPSSNLEVATKQYVDNNSSSISQDISDIEAKIPDEASSTNKLADKNYVNESITKSSAFYRGSFASYAALIAIQWQTTDPDQPNFVSNNDYAYVEDDETHNDEAWRYGYLYEEGGQNNGWYAQYRINESPFSTEQLNAINSGINSTLVTQIGTNQTNISNHISNINNPHSVTKAQVGLGNVDNTSDLDKPISTATQTALNSKQNTLTAGSNIQINNNVISATDTTYSVMSYSEAIAGSSITNKLISAYNLNAAIQNKISNIPNSDYDANEGEAGYIENRPFYTEKINSESIYADNILVDLQGYFETGYYEDFSQKLLDHLIHNDSCNNLSVLLEGETPDQTRETITNTTLYYDSYTINDTIYEINFYGQGGGIDACRLTCDSSYSHIYWNGELTTNLLTGYNVYYLTITTDVTTGGTIHKLDNKYLDFDPLSYMQKGVDYVTAGQKSGITLGDRATAEGYDTISSGNYSHAEGNTTTASGNYSHAEGFYTTARRRSQHVFGECNVLDTTGSTTSRGKYVEIVGNGTSFVARSNARTLDWSGNEWLAGKLTVGADPTDNMDVATKQYVDNHTPVISYPVTSVNNKTGAVTLTASDVGAQSTISVSGVLKGDGSGNISAAVAGTDYQAPLPSQSGNSGKFLTTNGSALSWGEVDALPSQTGNAGKFLTTNGTAASWADILSVSSRYIGTITGDSTTTTFTINHNLNSRDVLVDVYNSATYDSVIVDITRTTVNSLTVEFNTAPTSGTSYTIVVLLTTFTNANNITIDTSLDDTSTNPVQNKAIKSYIDNHTPVISYPVTSVNSKTGAVALNASDVGALSDTTDVTKWDGVTLNKTSYVGSTNMYVPYMTSTSATEARLAQLRTSPGANGVPQYSSSGYLASTTPAASDNSTNVATTAFVKTAIDNAVAAAINTTY